MCSAAVHDSVGAGHRSVALLCMIVLVQDIEVSRCCAS